MLLFSALNIFQPLFEWKMKRSTSTFYNEKLSVHREKMRILSIKKASDFVNLPQSVLEYSIENPRIVN